MTLSWLRLILSTLFVVAALTGAATAFGASASHACPEMAQSDDCPHGHGDDAGMPQHCSSAICGALQLTSGSVSVTALTGALRLPSRIDDDSMPGGRSARPDLRPPIS
jgi:hypothetical protein